MKMNKKGFTIVELVIVIAVIAILAAVMIPTFSSVVTNAKASAAEQKVAAAWKEALSIELADGVVANGDTETVNNIVFTFSNAKGDATASFTGANAINGYTGATITNGKVELNS